MQRLFLSSSFEEVTSLFINFAEEKLSGKTVTFIPTAALHENINFYVESGKMALKNLGMIVDELEISKSTIDQISRKIIDNDYIYVSGGNTFFLLQELKRTGADKIIIEQINLGKPYIGESAGSIILSPNIEYVKYMDDYKIAKELTTYNALNILDFYPLPHYNSFPFEELVERIILKYESTLPLTPISNSQAILIKGNEFQIIDKSI